MDIDEDDYNERCLNKYLKEESRSKKKNDNWSKIQNTKSKKPKQINIKNEIDSENKYKDITIKSQRISEFHKLKIKENKNNNNNDMIIDYKEDYEHENNKNEFIQIVLDTVKNKTYRYQEWKRTIMENETSLIYISPIQNSFKFEFNNDLFSKHLLKKPKLELWNHQKDGINWMINRENDIDNLNCFGGMQCDEPGMGKTLQLLELIRLKNNESLLKTKNRFNGSTIIISTKIIIDYWIEFIELNYPSKTFEILVLLPENDLNQKDYIENYNFYDLIFTTYHIVSSSFKYFDHNIYEIDNYDKNCKKFKWIFENSFLRILCDESDILINRNTLFNKSIRNIKSKHRWFITGTPLRNKINDTKSAFEFINLKIHFNNNNELKNILNKVMIRRLKNDKGVFINENNIKNHYFNECHVEIRFIDFKDNIEQLIYQNYKKKLNNSNIFKSITKLRQSCINPFIINNIDLPEKIFRINFLQKENDEEYLNIINKGDYNYLLKKRITLDQNEKFQKCLNILNNGKINSKKEENFIKEECNYFDFRLIPKFSTKGIEILNYINETPKDDKIIIYFESIRALIQISYELSEKNITFLILSGKNKESNIRYSILKEFKNNKSIKVLLITKVCNQGISLVEANHIIILAPGWTPWPEIQAIHRLYRPGQQKNVKVLYFIIKNSIEEYIMKLSFHKLELSHGLFNTINLKFDDFLKTKNDLPDEEFKEKLINSFIK